MQISDHLSSTYSQEAHGTPPSRFQSDVILPGVGLHNDGSGIEKGEGHPPSHTVTFRILENPRQSVALIAVKVDNSASFPHSLSSL